MELNEFVKIEKHSFKLMKMSKGYNWEIRVVDDDIELMKLKIKALNDWAIEQYGAVTNEN